MFNRFFLILFLIFLSSCSKEKPLYEPRELNNGYKVYQEGYEAFERGDFFYAQKNPTQLRAGSNNKKTKLSQQQLISFQPSCPVVIF